MNSLDIFVEHYFLAARTPVLTNLMYSLTSVFDASYHFVLITICFTFLIYLYRNIRYALLFISTLTFGAIVVVLLKNLFDIARPLDGFITVLGNSFPSYHATSATIFFVMLIYIFDSYFKSYGRIIFNTICVGGVLIVAFSRVYLGVHWLSDVLFGIILGVLISYVSIKIFKSVMFSGVSRQKTR